MQYITSPDLEESLAEDTRPKRRDASIDILRFIGISLIILAHVEPETHIFHLRSFDVPMMLFISGLTLSSRKPDFSPRYFAHRFTRLLLPVYVFLTAYFMLTGCLQGIGIDFGILQRHIIGSYMLNEGIGYVWIIRVFLLVSLITPFIILATQKLSKSLIFLFIFVMLVVIDVLISYGIGMQNVFVRDYVYYTLGYCIPFTCGLILPKLSLRKQLMFISIALTLLIIDWISGNSFAHLFDGLFGNQFMDFISFNNHKYPPQSYFILYGLLMSAICYVIIVKLKVYRFLTVFEFIGCNTIWIYLYHIPLIQITGKMDLHWGFRWLIVYALATLITYTQVKLVNRITSNYSWGKKFQFLKG